MKELRYTSNTVFFIVILFLLYVTYQNIGLFVPYIVILVVIASVTSFFVLMGSVSLTIWRAFTVSGEVEKAKGKVRIPRKKAE